MKLGKFITIEGIEGAGKSTQINLIKKHILQSGKKIIITREPGGTNFGEEIRKILLNKNTGSINPISELMLMFAARKEHIENIIMPNLKNGIWVISDRFTDSSYAYQGGGRGISFDKIRELEKWSLGDFKPDLSLFLDIEINISNSRVENRGAKDRFEEENNLFFARVFQAYKKRIAVDPERIKNINANNSIEQTFVQIQPYLDKL